VKVEVTHNMVYDEADFKIPYSQVDLPGGHSLRYADSGRVSRKRVDTLFEKEPTTITWLDHMTADDVLYDVGANVGMYTVYGSALRGVSVYAFEPEALNYAELNKNIFLNGLNKRVLAFCCAVTDREVRPMDVLYLSRFTAGFSHHDFGENRWAGPVTNLAKSKEQRPRQGCIGVSLDYAIGEGKLPLPTHIKVDVDGLECNVVAGAGKLLDRGSQVKTVLIETDFSVKSSVNIITGMTDRGWDFSYDQVCTNRYGKMSREQWEADFARRAGGCNIIYFRDAAYHKYWRAWTKDAPPYNPPKGK
jgi:FkbM family methyltransferase